MAWGSGGVGSVPFGSTSVPAVPPPPPTAPDTSVKPFEMSRRTKPLDVLRSRTHGT